MKCYRFYNHKYSTPQLTCFVILFSCAQHLLKDFFVSNLFQLLPFQTHSGIYAPSGTYMQLWCSINYGPGVIVLFIHDLCG